MAFQANDPGDHHSVVREFKSRRPHHFDEVSGVPLSNPSMSDSNEHSGADKMNVVCT